MTSGFFFSYFHRLKPMAEIRNLFKQVKEVAFNVFMDFKKLNR
jgi:hypothetical protein